MAVTLLENYDLNGGLWWGAGQIHLTKVTDVTLTADEVTRSSTQLSFHNLRLVATVTARYPNFNEIRFLLGLYSPSTTDPGPWVAATYTSGTIYTNRSTDPVTATLNFTDDPKIIPTKAAGHIIDEYTTEVELYLGAYNTVYPRFFIGTHFVCPIPHGETLYGPVNGQSRAIRRLYGSVNGQAKEIKKLYGSVNGVSKRIY